MSGSMAVSVQCHTSQNIIAKDAVGMLMPEASQLLTHKWYFSRKELECHTPSRSDGIDYKQEQHLRKLYCTFMQELGIELKVPQMSIATAMMFCHRFYTRQSHAKNDWQTIATVCMFLACKAEETPRWLGELVVVAYKLIYKWDPSASRRIREIYDKQKDLIVTGERLLLTTLAFDLNIEHPYRSLVAALKRLDITHKELVKVAWNFVNDWLCTSLCLQHKPHYIAAGSLFLAAKVKKVKLPTAKGKAWWMEFDVSPKLLEDVIQQMMSLWEQSQSQAVALKDQKGHESSTVKATPYSPKSSTMSGSRVVQDSKTIAFKGAGEPTKSSCAKIEAFDIKATTYSPQSATLSGSRIVQDSKMMATKEAGEPTKSATFSCVKKEAFDIKATTCSPRFSTLSDPRFVQDSKTIASKDSGEPTKPATSSCVKKEASDNVHDTSRATIYCHTSVSGNASVTAENSKIFASMVPCKAAKSVSSDCVEKQAFANVNGTSKETPICQTSDTGSGVSAVEDGDSGEPVTVKSDQSSSCKVVLLRGTFANSQVDVNRIREKLKNRNSIKSMKRKRVEDMVDDIDIDGEAWIERELENGIVLESNKSMKRKRVEDMVDDIDIDGEAWIERELENGIVLDSSYQRKI